MQVRCEWGLSGIEALRGWASVFIIVDVLSFCTAVDIATARGARILPFPWFADDAGRDRAEAAAREAGALLAKPRRATGGQFSLSPASLQKIETGIRLMLPSPNGSRLSLACGDTPVLAGCLRNASAVASRARQLAGDGGIAVIPAGERWPDGSLRPAIEDWLGAGAIVAALDLTENAEARLARLSYAATLSIEALVRASRSGLELVEAGFAQDVDLALDIGASSCAPLFADGAYQHS